MDVVLVPLLQVIYAAISLYIWVIIISAVLSWLVAFNVVNTHNRFIYTVMDVTYRVTEPALRPIRRWMPNTGGMDFSPLVLIFGLWFVQLVLQRIMFQL